METLTSSGQLSQRLGAARTISGMRMRERFCRKIVEWGIDANSKGIDLDFRFSSRLPEYFAGDEELFFHLLTWILRSSIHHTPEGSVCISVYSDLCPDSRHWWLTMIVEDCGNGLPLGTISYIYGTTADIAKYTGLRITDHPEYIETIVNLRRLRDLCRLQNGELVITNLMDNENGPSSCSLGTQYLASIPFQKLAFDCSPLH